MQNLVRKEEIRQLFCKNYFVLNYSKIERRSSAFLSPEHIINSYLYPLMVKEHLALKNKLEAIQMQNTDFYEKISSQREEIMQLVTFMKKTIEELDLAVQRSIQTPIQTLQTQMDEIVPILQAGL